MRRLSVVIGFGALAAWACSHDYTGQGVPTPPDAGTGSSGDSDAAFTPANLPGLVLQSISVPRGETRTVQGQVTRDGHEGALTIVAEALPAGITIAPVSVDPGTSVLTLQVTVAATATEGSSSLSLDLLDGNLKIATGTTILQVAPLRPGALDPDFGNGGFVDLDLPNSLIAFSPDGTLYVNAASGLTRWKNDGTHDPLYGPFPAATDESFWTMAASDTGQVYFAGAKVNSATSAIGIVARTTTNGKAYDGAWAGGVSAPPTTAGLGGAYNTIAVMILPTAVYAVVKLERDSNGSPGPMTVARLTLGGASDATYGQNGFITLPQQAIGPEKATFAPIGDGHFLLSVPDLFGATGRDFYYLLEGAGTSVTTRVGDFGVPGAIAFDPAGSFVARSLDGGTAIVRVGDAGLDPTFDVDAGSATINALSVEDGGRPLAAGCSGGIASWTRWLPDGGADLDYRSGTTSELACVLAAQPTEKYVYLAGLGGAAGQLRIARLIR